MVNMLRFGEKKELHSHIIKRMPKVQSCARLTSPAARRNSPIKLANYGSLGFMRLAEWGFKFLFRLPLPKVLVSQKGFNMLEVLIAIVIFSLALTALSSVSLGVMRGNDVSKMATEASILAQDTLESIRSTQYSFNLGLDMMLDPVSSCQPTVDDKIPPLLTNCNTGNDYTMDAATLFASPDHAYKIDALGVEDTLNVLDNPSLVTTSKLRRSWTIKDNAPALGMKVVTVVVGWKTGNTDKYLEISSALQGN